MTKSESLTDALYQDGRTLLNIGIASVLGANGTSSYSEICGSFEDGCNQWASHNVYDVTQVENDKYFGWLVVLYDGYGHPREEQEKLYIEKSTLEYALLKTKNWKHCRNTFTKFLKRK